MRSRTDKEKSRIDENNFLLLQLHNSLIECIDTCNLRFFRLLDVIGPTIKEYNYNLADLVVGNSKCGTKKITRVIS